VRVVPGEEEESEDGRTRCNCRVVFYWSEGGPPNALTKARYRNLQILADFGPKRDSITLQIVRGGILGLTRRGGGRLQKSRGGGTNLDEIVVGGDLFFRPGFRPRTRKTSAQRFLRIWRPSWPFLGLFWRLYPVWAYLARRVWANSRLTLQIWRQTNKSLLRF
jgi:hypothetical protein